MREALDIRITKPAMWLILAGCASMPAVLVVGAIPVSSARAQTSEASGRSTADRRRVLKLMGAAGAGVAAPGFGATYLRGFEYTRSVQAQGSSPVKVGFIESGNLLQCRERGRRQNLLENVSQFGHARGKHFAQPFPVHSQWLHQHFMFRAESSHRLRSAHRAPDRKIGVHRGE